MKRLLLLSVLLAGCGGGGAPSEPPRLPGGFARFESGGVSFGHPAGWTKDASQPGLVEFYGAQGAGGLPPQVALGAGPSRNSLASVVRLHKDMQKIRFPGYRVTEDRSVAVAGAAGAHRISAEYAVQRPGRERTLLRQVDLLVLTRDGRQLDFFVRAPAADFTAARLAAVLDTFHLA